MRNIDYPFGFDSRGHTAIVEQREHIRDMVEQLLFTSPGERVNRPDFGAGLLQMVFEPLSPELKEMLQFIVKGSLEKWLGDLIEVTFLDVTTEQSTLTIILNYVVRATGKPVEEQFQKTRVMP